MYTDHNAEPDKDGQVAVQAQKINLMLSTISNNYFEGIVIILTYASPMVL